MVLLVQLRTAEWDNTAVRCTRNGMVRWAVRWEVRRCERPCQLADVTHTALNTRSHDHFARRDGYHTEAETSGTARVAEGVGQTGHTYIHTRPTLLDSAVQCGGQWGSGQATQHIGSS